MHFKLCELRFGKPTRCCMCILTEESEDAAQVRARSARIDGVARLPNARVRTAGCEGAYERHSFSNEQLDLNSVYGNPPVEISAHQFQGTALCDSSRPESELLRLDDEEEGSEDMQERSPGTVQSTQTLG